MFEKILESPLDQKEIKPVNPKGNQSWIFIGSTNAESVAPILWPPDVKSQLLEKTLMLGMIKGRRRWWRQMMRCLDGITDSMGMSLSNLQDSVTDREAWHAAVHGITKSQHDWAINTMGDWGRWPNLLLLYINISAFSLCLSDYKPLSIWMLHFSFQQTWSQYQSYFISNTTLLGELGHQITYQVNLCCRR